MTCSRYAVGITEGFPGAHIDKAIIRYDLTRQTVRELKWFREMEYYLKMENSEDAKCYGVYASSSIEATIR